MNDTFTAIIYAGNLSHQNVDGNETDLEGNCDLWPSDRRWYMVAVAGASLSFISLFTNLLIARVLLSAHRSHFFFLGLLALSDSFVSFMYGPVIAMEIIKDRLQVVWLAQMYNFYIAPLLALCQTAMTFSCYLIILGTIERLLITRKAACLPSFRRNRTEWTMFMFIMSLVLRGTIYFEIQIVKNGDCEGTAEYVPSIQSLAVHWLYDSIFRFYIKNIATVFIPFFLLAILNFSIVRTLRKQQRTAEMFRFASSEHKTKVRSATRLLVLIVFSYLVANFLNVIVTAWEYVDFESTSSPEIYVIYETCADVTSLLYILSCSSRLFVYISCNKEIRTMVCRYLCGDSNATRKSYTVAKSAPRSPISGTQFDRVAVMVARRLIVQDDTASGEASPLHSVVYSNKFASKNRSDI